MIDKKLEVYLSKNFLEFKDITDNTREDNKKRVFTGGVRINRGMYRTTEEDLNYRELILNTKLP